MKNILSILLIASALTACGQNQDDPAAEVAKDAPRGRMAIEAGSYKDYLSTLASDEFEGRAPSTAGEEKTIQYLAKNFKAIGLKPGNGDSYFQEVPVVAITADPKTRAVIKGQGDDLSLAYGDDIVTWTTRVTETVTVDDSEMVFVGYGINAPEVNWNDYDGIDVTGKTVVVLVNDPGFATQNPAVFDGNSMTYYGRYTYKYEEALRQGAAAVLIVHKTEDAAYPWSVVQSSWIGAKISLQTPNNNMDQLAVEAWVQEDKAKAIFARAGLDFDALKTAASKPDFKAVPLKQTFSTRLQNSFKKSMSHNVIGVLPGTVQGDEYFLYMAHWDHFGIGAAIDGDNIYNGAYDNSSGTAALLELAKAYATGKPMRRSLVFVAVTAEEQGLLGSKHYAENPTVPLNKIVAGLNMDGINTIGATKDLKVIGYGFSELDGVLKQAAAQEGRYLVPDTEPEKGYYFRSDHFELAKFGVPMIYPEAGIDHITKGKAYGEMKAHEYTQKYYHQPSDEITDDWVFDGAIADIRLFYDVGRLIASGDLWPNWVEGNQFRVIRDKSLIPAK